MGSRRRGGSRREPLLPRTAHEASSNAVSTCPIAAADQGSSGLTQDGLLTIPDFSGNKFFNSLGNILANPKAGVMVPDFDRGHILLLTGEAWIGLGEADQQEATRIEGAERIWRLKPLVGLWLRNALSIAFAFRDWSSQTIATGTWI
jgi:hypothetical protein